MSLRAARAIAGSVLTQQVYGYAMRFEGVKGTNPEELLGAAQFQSLAADAKANCAVSKLLRADIAPDATLN